MTKRGLGKGLAALIPTELAELAEAAAASIREVHLDAIAPNPHQPRQKQDLAALQELADSIREHGLIQPLIVTTALPDQQVAGVSYQLIAGERRWAAARLAGLSAVPVIVKEATAQQMLELALVENIQRADLNPLEEAAAYRQLIDEFGLTQEEVAARVGKSRVAVANVVRLLRLPDEVKAALLEGQISEGHARALLAAEAAEKMIQLLRVVIRQGLNVRQTEELVRRGTAEAQPQAPAPPSPDTAALEDRFRQALGTKVRLLRSQKGGRLVIHFFSEEELQAIYDAIVGSE
ncbi:MAG: ParB/RepB/Spo0J family partition protein [Anaerolineae bacterium]|nr:MAG: ParB/RepB/Spo0J family partition protein [Anaerolineae bacterium]